MIFLMIFLINCQSPANNEKFFYSLEDLGLIGWKEKGEFQTVFDDTSVNAKKVKKLVFCSGKLYYDLVKKR